PRPMPLVAPVTRATYCLNSCGEIIRRAGSRYWKNGRGVSGVSSGLFAVGFRQNQPTRGGEQLPKSLSSDVLVDVFVHKALAHAPPPPGLSRRPRRTQRDMKRACCWKTFAGAGF